MGSWHVGANASTEVPWGRIFEWRQRWRVAVRDATKEETATTQDGKDKTKIGVKGSDRRRTYLGVILDTQRDSESEQQNDVGMVGADSGANGAAAASGPSAGTGATSVTGEKKRAPEEAKRRMERIYPETT